MSAPSEIDDLASKITGSHPSADVEVSGTCIDVRLGDQRIVIEWDERHGYGISLGAGSYLRVGTPGEVLEQLATHLAFVTCGILDEEGTFACRKAWGHDNLTHSGVRRDASGGGYGKSWIADDEEHLRRLAIKEKS